MTSQCVISDKTRLNWMVDMLLFVSAFTSSVSGLYLLFAPRGGFRGGRNAVANIFLGLERSVWKDIHIYAGLVMIAIAVYHIVLHWDWIKCTAKRAWRKISGDADGGNGWTNVFVDVIALAAFFVTAVSGLYFYLVPHGGARAGLNTQVIFLFSRGTWNWLHEWIGLTFIVAAAVHFILHWDWMVKVAGKMIGIRIPAETVSQSILE